MLWRLVDAGMSTAALAAWLHTTPKSVGEWLAGHGPAQPEPVLRRLAEMGPPPEEPGLSPRRPRGPRPPDLVKTLHRLEGLYGTPVWAHIVQQIDFLERANERLQQMRLARSDP